MEFIKVRNGYLIKNGNGRIISEKEKLEIENHELVLEDINSSGCVKEITKKISKNKKRIKEIEKENVKINVDLQPINSERVVKYIKELENLKALQEVSPIVKGKTALEEKVQDEDNKETSESI